MKLGKRVAGDTMAQSEKTMKAVTEYFGRFWALRLSQVWPQAVSGFTKKN